jgi:hypothetical protein
MGIVDSDTALAPAPLCIHKRGIPNMASSMTTPSVTFGGTASSMPSTFIGSLLKLAYH